MTLTSGQNPFGVAISTKAEAEKFEEMEGFGYSRGYNKLTVFDTAEEAVAGIKPLMSQKKA